MKDPYKQHGAFSWFELMTTDVEADESLTLASHASVRIRQFWRVCEPNQGYKSISSNS